MYRYDSPSKKRCILTEQGKNKLNNALENFYPNGYSVNGLHKNLGIARRTIDKIIYKQQGVVYSSLDKLFSNLAIDLESGDWKSTDSSSNRPQNQTSSTRKLSSDREKPSVSEVKKALEEVNYIDQVSLFTKWLNCIPSAHAFLIHGDSGYGQRWLVNRLSYKVPNLLESPVLIKRFHLTRYRTDIEKLWSALASEVESPKASPETIVETLYQHWETQVIMLSLHDVHLITGDYLQQLMNDFWYRLAERVNSSTSSSDHPFLLFLIDNQGYQAKGKLNLSLAREPEPIRSYFPLDLKEIQPFAQLELKRWVGTQRELFSFVKTHSVQEICQDITANQTPEKAFEAICSWFGLDWDWDIKRSLPL